MAVPQVVARSLVVAYPGRDAGEPAACGPLDIVIAPGGFLTLIGDNGRGKSALLATLAGLIAPVSGSVAIGGLDPFAASTRRAARLDIGVVFQEPETQHLTDAVEREIAFPLENLGWTREAITGRVEELLAALGLGSIRRAAPAHLSGGEAQRVALAAAIAPRPRLLLLDEPASYLDPPGRAALVAALTPLRAAGTAVVWSACARRESPDAGATLDLGPGDGCMASSPVADQGVATGSLLWEGTGLALTRRDARGTTRLWGGLDLQIATGHRLLLRGDNGTGKTALLDLLAGLISTRAGGGLEGTFRVATPDGVPPPRLRYLTQFPESQLFAATVAGDVGFGLPGPDASVRERVAAALTAVGLDPRGILERSPDSLSLGERRRVALAGALSGEPDVLLLDEPTAGLDDSGRLALERALQGWAAGRGGTAPDGAPVRPRTLVVASHDPAWGGRPGWQLCSIPPPQRVLSGAPSDHGSRP